MEGGDSIFSPTNKDLRIEYPELNDYYEFKELSSKDLKFVWFFACKSSPLHDLDLRDYERATMAAVKAYGDTLSESRMQKIRSLDFGQDLSLAIDRMKKFIPAVRSEARSAFENMLRNVMDIARQDITDLDVKARKEYVSTVKDINDLLPKLVRAHEQGFGVRSTGSSGSNDDVIKDNLMDKLISQEK